MCSYGQVGCVSFEQASLHSSSVYIQFTILSQEAGKPAADSGIGQDTTISHIVSYASTMADSMQTSMRTLLNILGLIENDWPALPRRHQRNVGVFQVPAKC